MKQEELMLSLAKLMFPSELLDHFSLVHITETPTDVVFHLEERDILQNPLPGHEYEKNGHSSRTHDQEEGSGECHVPLNGIRHL